MKYFLMNKDEILLSFKTEKKLGVTQIFEIQHYSNLRPKGFVDINTWLDQRDYAKHKEHFQKWLKEWGINDVDGFISITHCLGLNDCLWVKPTDSNLRWGDVNLYENNFTDVASKTAFETGLYGLKLSTTSPEFTMEGSFPKFWKKYEKDICLYKAGATGASNVGLEPYSEYLSSSIAKQLSKQDVVFYDLIMYKKKLCSKCSLFTNTEIGFIPFYKILDSNKKYNISDVIDICETLGFGEKCAEMFFLDSLIFNQDRHLGNFGLLVNNETFEILDFSPLFDFNISMLCNAMETDLKKVDAYFEEYQVGHKLGGSFYDVGSELFKEYRFKIKDIDFPIHEKYNLSNERIKLVEDIFQYNKEKILGNVKSLYIPKEKSMEFKMI